MSDLAAPGRELVYSLRRATEAAACAAFEWIGRGDKDKGAQSAIDAMHAALRDVDLDGRVLIGEGRQDDTPHLYNGEQVGRADAAFKADIAVDPIEGTSYLAKGLTNALAVMAVTPRGAMMDPGPAFYMEKLVAPPAARGKLDPTWPTKQKLRAIASSLKKDVSALTIYVLEKPRHRALVEEIHEAGARVAFYPAGDVAGAILAAIPNSGIDALMGTGGASEGVMSAAAVRALSGEFLGRIDPQLQSEAKAVQDAGIDIKRWHARDEIIASDDTFFLATGITTGLMLEGVERLDQVYKVQTMMVSGATGERQLLTSFIPADKIGRNHSARDAA